MATQLKILVVDDQEFERIHLTKYLVSRGHEVVSAADGTSALKMFETDHADVSLVITDMQMPVMGGIELTRKMKAIDPHLDIIVMTAQAGIETAVEAIRAGASNYLVKPIKLEEVELRIDRMMERKALQTQSSQLEKENRRLRGEMPLIAHSPCMRELVSKIEVAAATESNVLLTGETGVGKEVLARYIHDQSKRVKGPFIAINCSAIPENLLESEFFGHEKGAFTGADQRAIGLFERANGGTLFLDELGEMDLKLQPKILRAIEGRVIRRVSGTADIKIDVRVIAATNRDLKKRIEEKTFREDLYFRLNVIHAEIPPLRERREDISALIDHMVRKLVVKMGVKPVGVDDSYIDVLKSYSFPGNVRELANLVERSLIYSSGQTLTASMLPAEVIGSVRTSNLPKNEKLDSVATEGPLSENLASYEKKLIEEMLLKHNGDLTQVSLELKISRSSLYSKLGKHKIKNSE